MVEYDNPGFFLTPNGLVTPYGVIHERDDGLSSMRLQNMPSNGQWRGCGEYQWICNSSQWQGMDIKVSHE